MSPSGARPIWIISEIHGRTRKGELPFSCVHCDDSNYRILLSSIIKGAPFLFLVLLLLE